MSSYAVGGFGFSSSEVLAFVEAHAQENAGLVRREMNEAQGRNKLSREIADLAAGLAHCKDAKDWPTARDLIGAFMKEHPELVGTKNDLTPLYFQADAWAHGNVVVKDSYHQTNYDNGGEWGANFTATDQVVPADPFPHDACQSMVQQAIDTMTSWKDEVSGDDKLAIMQLTQDAEEMKNIYSVGSNLLSSGNQTKQTLIGNMRG